MLWKSVKIFDIRKDCGSLFKGLEIAKYQEVCDDWMNQWPVISLSFKAIEGYDFPAAISSWFMKSGSFIKSIENKH